jgi:hypothetical protein
MSYNVLVIPEDFTKDEHILKPLIKRVLSESGKANAVVEVCRNPNFQGISEATKLERLRNEVVRRYPMVNLLILFVDRDGRRERELALQELATHLVNDLKAEQHFLTEVARQEVEIFPVAGHDLDEGVHWNTVRSDPDVKNTYFRRLVKREGVEGHPHDGRKKLMVEAMKRWGRICSRCPEETINLVERIKKTWGE